MNLSIDLPRSALLTLTVVVLAWPRPADGAPAPDLKRLVEDYHALRPSEAVSSGLGMDEARRFQGRFVKALERRLGPPVGYKVGLVTLESQSKYGAKSPVHGVLLSKMMLDNGATVPAAFGTSPICEADLIAVVKDKAINKARTTQEVVEHLKEIAAFIELPDALLSTNRPVDSAALTAANVGARLGVLGGRVTVQPTPQFIQALANMSIVTTDQDGTVLGKAQGNAILDQPLHAVLWLIEDLKRTGGKLKPGDLISLGGVTMIKPKAGQTISVTYDGLPGGPVRAVVSFN